MIIQNEQEREALREGGKRLAELLHTLSKKVAPGTSTLDLEQEARLLIQAYGDTPAFLNYQPEGTQKPYPAALCVSINDAIVHGIPNERALVIQEGDLVTLDCGIIHEGFVVDAAVSVIAGEGSQEDRLLIEAVTRALEAAIAVARVGNTTGDIGAAISKVIEPYGFSVPAELGGHGVGGGVHEEPFVPNRGREGEGEELLEGMVLAIEPMCAAGSARITVDADGHTFRTRDGSRAAQVEHTVIVGVDGAEVLTRHTV